jgi:hypothetical protein
MNEVIEIVLSDSKNDCLISLNLNSYDEQMTLFLHLMKYDAVLNYSEKLYHDFVFSYLLHFSFYFLLRNLSATVVSVDNLFMFAFEGSVIMIDN